jgi:predicted metalloprotease
MLWRNRRESENVEDRRGQGGGFGGFGSGGGFRIPIGMGGGGRRAGGGSIVVLIVVVLISWALGINPLALLEGTGSLQTSDEPGTSAPTGSPVGPGASQQAAPAQDEMSRFVRVVLAETEDTWQTIFSREGENYPAPVLVLFTDRVQSACGFASAASGPFYCPNDRRLYIDLAFYEELRRRFQAPGDFAQAYVIAHEVGHHIQNLIGVLPKFHQMRQRMSEADANAMSVRVELQADCFAGIWGRDAADKGLLEQGDLEEALNAAAQIGDDAIQRRMQGYVVPESFNHGTSAQRARWFKRGFESKSLQACDTFNANPL